MVCAYCGTALFEDEQGNYLHLWSGWHNCDPHLGGEHYATPVRVTSTVRLAGAVL